ncbi:hypothetical protein H5410_064175 [Solanum commersonii]|uniref:Disease resistance protein RGA3 n=1 Tax=Solanum commersonii TaxID=4109 RepID=A0A9J5W057_SOLCO|nr:hypothetical protein H5410_064175 [Solanum commersonii]
MLKTRIPHKKKVSIPEKLHIGGFCNLKGLQRMEGEEQYPMLEEMRIWIALCLFSNPFFCEEIRNLGGGRCKRFSTIQAVLEDAQEKQLKDKAIKNWLQKLNAVAYKVDDLLDECKYEAARLKQSRLECYHPKATAFRHKIGKRIKEMMEKLDAIAKERMDFHLHEKIKERQVARPETGKTTLAQMVFNDKRVTDHFHPKIWICVSDDFDEKRLIKAIAESIEGRPLLGDMDLAPLQKKLQELLNGKRYLLVLDDVWNEDQQKWANLRAVLKVGASGAFVLTTTRLEKVGSIMGTLQPYELSNLSPEDCWFLFMQRAFGHQKEINLDLVAIGKEIVKKCGGVPLAAKTLGGILRFKREEREWENVRDSEIWNLPQDESSILPALRLSYHHLPLDLRQCFAYCAVFPKDTEMEKEKLISLWMAHGFILSKGNMELEDVGDEVWKELYLRLLKLDEVTIFHWRSSTFKILGPLYNNMCSLPKQLCKLQNLQTLNLRDCYSLCCLPKETSKLGSLRNLLLDGCYGLTCMPPRIGSLTCLKTLGQFVVGMKKGYQLSELGSLNLYGSITILQLERVKNDKDAKEANLSAKGNLHSLIMSWNISRPHSYESEEDKVLEALKPHSNLTSLTIHGFRGIRLPEWMNHSVLKNIVSITISDCRNCSCLPPFGELPCLESLELSWGSADVEYVEEVDIDVDSGFPTRIRFPSLRKLVIWDFCNLKGLLKKEGGEQFPVLEEMEILCCPILTLSSNLRALTSLRISNNEKATSFPEEMFKSLENLKYLNISHFKNLKELPTSLASLNNLKCLDIHYCYALESLPEEGLEGLTSLTELFVEHCNMLKCLPEGLQHLTNLTSLRVTGCPEVAKRCERGIGEDWHKIAHIPNVKIY